MKCPKCHFDNPDTQRFCGECGTQLALSEEAPISQTKTLKIPIHEIKRGTIFANRFEFIEELGQGGMGTVYKVYDKRIKEEVALKLLKPDISDDVTTIQRFSDELKFARKIVHKNVGRMYDLGEETGNYFITMEYVPGEDLRSFIKRVGQLPFGKAISIAKQVCEGLEEAHKLGVVHRDLKPSNIMIDKEGNASIMDFGIARSMRAKGVTETGMIVGTPEYMSPEQVEGEEPDQCSDIYSLGIILYEMVTGRVPFEGKTPMSVALKHKTETPLEPKVFNTQIPDDLSRVILKCLNKDKKERFQSAADLHSALNEIEEATTATVKSFPSKEPAVPKETKVSFSLQKLLLPPAIILGVIAIVVIIVTILRRGEMPATPTLGKLSCAVMYFENNSGDENLEHWRKGFAELLMADLSQSKYVKVLGREKLLSILRELNLQDAKSYSQEDLKAVAAHGGVENIIQGVYTKAGDIFRINITLQLAGTGDVLATESVEGHGEASLFSMVDELTRKIKSDLILSKEEIANDVDASNEAFMKDAIIASGERKPPKLIKKVDPFYPKEAKEKGVEGIVILTCRTDEQGNVEAIRVLRSIPLLDQAAIDAVMQWKYEPMIFRGGKAVPAIFTVTIHFNLK